MSDLTKIEGEQEIFTCSTGLAVSYELFFKQQHMTADDLLPVIHALARQCDGIIKESGLYAIRLSISKIR